MLKTLTKEQEARFSEWSSKWIDIGLQTGDADRVEMEKAIRSCYRFADLKEVPIIWVSSPMAGAFAAPIAALVIEELRKKGVLKDKAVDSAVRSAVYSAVRSAVDSAVYSAVRSAVDSAVRSAVDSAVYSAVDSAVRSAVDSAVDSAVGSDKKIFWHYWMGGQLWPAWAALTTFFTDVCQYKFKGDINDRIYAYAKTAQSGSYWWPNQDFVMVCERPREIHRNERGQLHNQTGMSISWPDGWGLYSLNGITVPEWLVNTDSGQIDPKLALTEKNVDVQREIIRKVGAERMLNVCKSKTLDIFMDLHTKGGNEYKLVEMEISENIRRKYLYFEHASIPGLHYAHPVPPTLTRAIHARAWMLGVAEVEELQRTTDEEIRECLPLQVA